MQPRKLSGLLVVGIALVLVPGAAADALAQEEGPEGPRSTGYLSGNIFAYVESAEGDLDGSSAGGGATFGFHIRPTWTFGGEVAVPGFISGGEEESAFEHRDISFAALLGWRPAMESRTDVRLLIGLAWLRLQTRTPQGDTTDIQGAVAVGIDLRIPVGGRFAIVPQARSHVTTGTFVFRGGVGFELGF